MSESARKYKGQYDGLPLRDADSDEDVIKTEYEPLQDNASGLAVSTVIRDAVWFHQGTKFRCLRAARVINSIVIILGSIFLQVFLLLGVWRLLCRTQEHTIRETYSQYEHLMYPNHTELNSDGDYRGIQGYRRDELFPFIYTDEASKICSIPLAHPYYLLSIILVWTFTCQMQLRIIVEQMYQLLVRTPTVGSLDLVLGEMDAGEDTHEHAAKIRGLTLPLKIFIAAFVQLPRLVTVVALLCLGCRWLVATTGLGDILLNGVALEFIIHLDGLLYNACTPTRNKISSAKLYVSPFRRLSKANFCTFFDAQIWAIASVMWALLYVYYFQPVLPDYRWDVHDLCDHMHEQI